MAWTNARGTEWKRRLVNDLNLTTQLQRRASIRTEPRHQSNTGCAVFKTPTLFEAGTVVDDGIDLWSAQQVLRLHHACTTQ